MSVVVEIRAAEGGEHSKILVENQYDMYVRLCDRKGL